MITMVWVSFCVQKPFTYYYANHMIFMVLDTVLFTTLVVYSAVILFEEDVVTCRTSFPEVSRFWFVIAFCAVVSSMYVLIIVSVCCCMTWCLCGVVCITIRQNREISMR